VSIHRPSLGSLKEARRYNQVVQDSWRKQDIGNFSQQLELKWAGSAKQMLKTSRRHCKQETERRQKSAKRDT
jgi:hypothetical protein